MELAARQSWLLFLLCELGLHSGIAAVGEKNYNVAFSNQTEEKLRSIVLQPNNFKSSSGGLTRDPIGLQRHRDEKKKSVHLGDTVVHSGLAVVAVGFGLTGHLLVLGSSLLESLLSIFWGRGCYCGCGSWEGSGHEWDGTNSDICTATFQSVVLFEQVLSKILSITL